MTDARALLAELEGLREQRAALAGRIAPLGRYSSLRNELCRRQARLTRRVLELEVMLRRAELPAVSPLPRDAGESEASDLFAPYGGEQPYWVRN